jgi:hypothetical protein
MPTLLDTPYYFERSHADPNNTATLTLRVDGPWLDTPEGLVFQLALDPRAEVMSVSYAWPEGQEEILASVSQDNPQGYYVWSQRGITMVRASIARPPVSGEHKLKVRYSVPFTPHVVPRWRAYSNEQ